MGLRFHYPPLSPKVGAVCGNVARTDLCGGFMRGIPTATATTSGCPTDWVHLITLFGFQKATHQIAFYNRKTVALSA